jgi:transposase InsO family protein
VEKDNFPVTVLCSVLQVSRAGYYAWVGRPPSAGSTRRQVLALKVRAVHSTSKGTYGSPRVYQELVHQGETVSEKTVAKIMQLEGLVARKKRRHKVTTDSRHTERIADNLLQRDFTAMSPNEVWVTDVTAIWSTAGWVYLAAMLDLYSRRVVGWATSQNNDTDLALAALNRAIAQRRPSLGLVHHSDRGSPYGSDRYHEALDAHGIIPSMSRKGDCWDNAVAESFFSSIKTERTEGTSYTDYAAVTDDVADYIDHFYNPERLHSTLGYISPIEYELATALHQEAA